MNNGNRRDLTHNLVLPTLLFAALGGMVWAVRGCSGFGAMKGCIFVGVTWGTAWWFIARDPDGPQSRRYASAWVILATTVGIGISGGRGWMQWPGFFAGHIQLNDKEFAAINPGYGFLWLPPNQWGKAIQWWIYYLLLLVISAIIVGHFSVSQIALFLGGAGLAR